MAFGLTSERFVRHFVVLDKSFLDATASAQLQYYAQHEWTFVIPEALPYELLRKRDHRRTATFFKLQQVQNNLLILPGIGEMFRAETQTRKPAPSVLRAHRIKLTPKTSQSGELEIDVNSMRSMQERTASLENSLLDLVEVWRSLGSLKNLRDARPAELPRILDELSQEIRDNRESMRQFYANHRHASFPEPELIDENWAYFRWIQVYLLAGLDYYRRYGFENQPNREKLLHERIDLDYIIPALLLGGLACTEKRFRRRFKFLRPDGVLLPGNTP
jgi:hypothetical protein